MTAQPRYLLKEAQDSADRYRRALEAVLAACDSAELMGMLLYPEDVRAAIKAAGGAS